MDIIVNMLPDYSQYTIWTGSFQILAAMIGLVSRLSIENTLLLCPSKTIEGVKLGSIGLIVAAGSVGLLVDHNPGVAWLAGIIAPELVKIAIETGPSMFKRMIGIK